MARRPQETAQRREPSAPPAGLAAAMASAPVAPSQDRLRRVRELLVEFRDNLISIADHEEAVTRLSQRNQELRDRDLVDIFQETGISALDLAPEGNLPAYEAKLRDYYKASISADWPQAAQDEALDWLVVDGAGDLIKTVYTVEFGRGEEKQAAAFGEMLAKRKFVYQRRRTVPWNTLTAWVKEQIEKFKRTLPLKLLGATAGQVVELKPKKEKR